MEGGIGKVRDGLGDKFGIGALTTIKSQVRANQSADICDTWMGYRGKFNNGGLCD